jgi:hypothetical protein
MSATCQLPLTSSNQLCTSPRRQLYINSTPLLSYFRISLMSVVCKPHAMLCIFRSLYSVYCLCVNVSCTAATRCQRNCRYIYIYIYLFIKHILYHIKSALYQPNISPISALHHLQISTVSAQHQPHISSTPSPNQHCISPMSAPYQLYTIFKSALYQPNVSSISVLHHFQINSVSATCELCVSAIPSLNQLSINLTSRHPRSRRESNPASQQASGRRTTC